MIAGPTTYRLLSDLRGSVRLVVDVATGAIAQRLDYDTFGNVIADSNPGFQPFGFSGGLYDPDTGVVLFGDRSYDPSSGRFISRDPLGLRGGTEPYTYANGDPINAVDPTGHFWSFLLAAAADGLIHAGVNFLDQLSKGDCINWGEVAHHGLDGFLEGAAIGGGIALLPYAAEWIGATLFEESAPYLVGDLAESAESLATVAEILDAVRTGLNYMADLGHIGGSWLSGKLGGR